MLPLEGIKVLDFTVAISGASGTQYLGDMGADVIKVEPLEGDFMRLTPSKRIDSPRFMGINRSKRSLCLNLKEEDGRKIALELARRSDVVVNNFRVGVMEKLGLGYDDIVKTNPKVIYVSQYGFGKTGPLARWVGGDMWTQAMAGVVSIQGSPSGPPYLGGVAWVDQGTGIMIALATMFALFVRERTGIGQQVETSLLDVCMSMQTAQMGDYLIDNNLVVKGGRGWAGHFPYGPYTAKDGDIMIISGYTNEEWALVCKLLEMEHFAVDPRYDTPQKRLERREEVYSILDEGFSKKTRAEWQQIFHRYRLRADPCLTYEELFSHPQVEANKIVETVQHSVEGPTKVVGIPIKLSETPGRVERAAPLLGEHTEEILRELGYSSQQIKVLEESGTVNIARASELKKREFRARWAKPPQKPSE